MTAILGILALCGATSRFAAAQEATSGFDLRTTLSGQLAGSTLLTDSPRNGAPVNAAFRAVSYPAIKWNESWSVSGTIQTYTHPYFYESFGTTGNGVSGNLLQASLNYSRVSSRGSLLIRAGQLTTAFGAFSLSYDDAENPVVDLPMQYGYYYKPVSMKGFLAAQADVTRGKWDGRLQFANSSPANPRGITADDQYGNWSGGGGFTPRQGLRFGASAYRGPYLDRHYPFFFPGEISPSKLPAYAFGVDASWTHGHINLQGEWQRFVMPYTAIPVYKVEAGYVEARHVLSPRWYIAGRGGYTSASFGGTQVSLEAAAAFRPNRLQLIKFDYELRRQTQSSPLGDHTISIQLVTSLHLLSLSKQ